MKCELINSMGSDLSVVNAARVSFDKESEWQNEVQDWEPFITKKVLNFQDKGLIKYLAKHDHFTPFTHCMITLRETVPIFVARQRFKHTVGFSYNEVSRRYVDGIPEFYIPDVWRGRAENKKQGSTGRVYLEGDITDYYNSCVDTYTNLLESGVCPEQARMVLPQAMYTSYYVTGSLAAFARAYKLRSQSDAQVEIQELAKQWSGIIEPLFPVSWRSLTE
jgi:thymidylate synthase (FAD)